MGLTRMCAGLKLADAVRSELVTASLKNSQTIKEAAYRAITYTGTTIRYSISSSNNVLCISAL